MSEIIWYNLKMTSNTTPSPYVASASSQNSTTSGAAFNAFSGDNSLSGKSWITASTTTGWIQIYLGETKVVDRLRLTSRNNSALGTTTSPKDFKIQGSTNGLNFTTIKSIENETDWSSNETREFIFDNTIGYTYYRIDVTSNNGHETFLDIGEIVFGETIYYKKAIIKNSITNQHYSLADKTLILLPDASDETVIEHGIEASKEIKLDEDFDKINYIQETSDVFENGKVFKQKINISKIKKVEITTK